MRFACTSEKLSGFEPTCHASAQQRKRSDVSVTSAPPMLFPEAPVSATVVPEAALLAVLFGAFLFHPVNRLAVEPLLNGDVCHGGSWCGPVPMFLPWWEPNHVPGTNVFNRASPELCPTTASRHNQGLAQRVGVPGGPSPGLEGDTGTGHACRVGCLKEGVNADRAGKVLSWSFA